MKPKRLVHRLAGTLAILSVCSVAFSQTSPELEKSRRVYENQINEHKFSNRPKLSREEWKKEPKRTRPDLAWEQYFRMTRDPKTGEVPIGRRLEAMEQVSRRIKDQLNGRTEDAISGLKWTERGPNNIGGSSRAVMFDPNDPTNKKVWAGVAGGGLWYTDDITVSKPVWNKIDDFWSNLAVSWIVAAPNKQDFYVGTGEGWNGGSSYNGAGIWKSADAGKTWNRLESTATPDFVKVLNVAVSSQGTVLAATSTGMMRSTNAGAAWTKVFSPDTYGSSSATDIEIGPDGSIYASLGISALGKILKSSDDGATWKELTALPGTPQRLQIAVSPKNGNILYVAAQGSGSTLLPGGGLYKTTDGGTTWQTLKTPTSADKGEDGASQAWIHLTLAVDGNDDNHVIMGGLDLYRTTDGGANWKQISKWSNNGDLANLTCSVVHADHTNTLFVPGSSTSVLFGNDGGLYYTTRIADAATQDVIKERNNGYNVTQFYACALHPNAGSDYSLAGAQDNGSLALSQAGIGGGTEVTGGDGAYCFIDQDNPNLQITSYTNNVYYLSEDGGKSFPALSNNKDGSFINPADYDDRENILYSSRDANSIQRITGIGTKKEVGSVKLEIGSAASHLKVSPYSAPGSSTVYIGTEGGRIFKVTNAHASAALTDITGDLSQQGSISCIDIGASEQELIVTLSNYGVKSVWLSKNGGTNWVSKDESAHGLADIPVHWVMFNPKNRSQVILATEVGVWSTTDINAENPGWQPSSTNLANIRITMFKYRASDGVVLASSYGRGLFTSDIFAGALANFSTPNTTWFAGKPMSFKDQSLKAESWAWDFAGGATNSTEQNPTITFNAPGNYIVTLTVNGNSNLKKNVAVTILAEPTIPYSNGFESNNGGFVSKSLGGKGGVKWEWGAGKATKGNFNPAGNTATIEGTSNWMTSLSSHHGFNELYALESPPFKTKGLPTGDYILNFSYRSVTGDGAGLNVEYSVDGGKTWKILGSKGDTNGTDWYTDDAVPGLKGASGWVKSEFTVFRPSYKISAVSDIMNQDDLRFRIVFGAGNNANDGVQIDNFIISALSNTPPAVTTYSPAVGAASVARNTELVLTFDKIVQKGEGNITIKQAGADKETVAVSSANVKIEGNKVIVSPVGVLDIGVAAEILVSAGAFKDVGNNNFAGTEAGTWSFTVSGDANTAPTLSPIASVALKEDAKEQTVNLTKISSGDGVSQAVTITVKSDNQDLLPDASILLTYNNPETSGQLKYTIAKNIGGTANVAVTVADAGGLSLERKFSVNVSKTNDPPTFKMRAVNPVAEQGTTEEQVIKGLATDIDDGDPDEEQELNFIVYTSLDKLSSDDEGVDVFDEIDIDVETGDLYFTLLPEAPVGTFDVFVELYDDGEGEDIGSRAEGDSEDDNSADQQSFKLTVKPKEVTTGIEDELNESTRISLYPNPNNGKFRIKYDGFADTRFLDIYITNTEGKRVYQGQRTNFLQTYEGEIDAADFSNGIYILTVVSDQKVFKKRLVIVK